MNIRMSTARPIAVTSELIRSRNAASPVRLVAAMPEPTTIATSSPVPVNSAMSRRLMVAFTRA
jgi:hypothetical protein